MMGAAANASRLRLLLHPRLRLQFLARALRAHYVPLHACIAKENEKNTHREKEKEENSELTNTPSDDHGGHDILLCAEHLINSFVPPFFVARSCTACVVVVFDFLSAATATARQRQRLHRADVKVKPLVLPYIAA